MQASQVSICITPFKSLIYLLIVLILSAIPEDEASNSSS